MCTVYSATCFIFFSLRKIIEVGRPACWVYHGEDNLQYSREHEQFSSPRTLGYLETSIKGPLDWKNDGLDVSPNCQSQHLDYLSSQNRGWLLDLGD